MINNNTTSLLLRIDFKTEHFGDRKYIVYFLFSMQLFLITCIYNQLYSYMIFENLKKYLYINVMKKLEKQFILFDKNIKHLVICND